MGLLTGYETPSIGWLQVLETRSGDCRDAELQEPVRDRWPEERELTYPGRFPDVRYGLPVDPRLSTA